MRANTVPAFALGDYEWILAFEGPDLGRIVELMWKLRYTDARRHVREETPFFTVRASAWRNSSPACPNFPHEQTEKCATRRLWRPFVSARGDQPVAGTSVSEIELMQ